MNDSHNQMPTNERLNLLLQKYVDRTIDLEEYEELFGYMGNPEIKDQILNFMDEHHKVVQADADVHETDWDAMYEQITHQQKNIRFGSLRKWKIAAAAVLFIVGGYTAFQLSADVEELTTAQLAYNNDVNPGGNKAILTLADGSKVSLTDHANGNLATQGNITIEKDADGELIYHIKDEVKGDDLALASKMNTLATPAGGTYHVVLSDGSKVWLNASSSIKFPASFAKDNRKVEIKGEAYFEIEKDKSRPFYVIQDNAEIKVLGTHFNVMSYPDEVESAVTLLEGSIQFTKNNQAELLKPGMQILYANNQKNTKQAEANIEEVMAWKNELFVFNNTNIDEIMKDLVRWYNVEVKFAADKPNISFTGVIPRNANVSKVLKALEATGDVKFGIEGKVITCSKKTTK